MSTQTHNNQAQSSHLTGKVALIQGGSRGIGAAIAKRLARDGAITLRPSRDTCQAGRPSGGLGGTGSLVLVALAVLFRRRRPLG